MGSAELATDMDSPSAVESPVIEMSRKRRLTKTKTPEECYDDEITKASGKWLPVALETSKYLSKTWLGSVDNRDVNEKEEVDRKILNEKPCSEVMATKPFKRLRVGKSRVIEDGDESEHEVIATDQGIIDERAHSEDADVTPSKRIALVKCTEVEGELENTQETIWAEPDKVCGKTFNMCVSAKQLQERSLGKISALDNGGGRDENEITTSEDKLHGMSCENLTVEQRKRIKLRGAGDHDVTQEDINKIEARENVEEKKAAAPEKASSGRIHANGGGREILSSKFDTIKKTLIVDQQIIQKDTKIEGVHHDVTNEIDQNEVEISIIAAVRKRASHFKSQASSLSVTRVVRLLEEDLRLKMYELDAYKPLIRKLVDEILADFDSSEATEQKKSPQEVNVQPEVDNVSCKAEPANSDCEDTEKEMKDENLQMILVDFDTSKVEESKIQQVSRQKESPQKMRGKSGVAKKRHKNEAASLSITVEGSGKERKGKSSQKNNKKIIEIKPTYGSNIEHLKKIIKACGLGVPPSVYKKAKQAPEEEREAALRMEMEAILSREGLSSNPSEKEIRKVKSQRERQRDLEGMDSSNILVESKRKRPDVLGLFSSW